ncbi:MAG: polysaccharide biosynthesis C-terminal domain-containing protein, partial [Tannerellaceae bacterium]|nr:polysaccharide biosynthesis C-terminal domain-containing protein [Tannerellaceae bacterium]
VDTAIVGHLESQLYIGAIALAAMIFNFIYWNFAFLRMGTSGFTAQAVGAGDRQEMMNILLRALTVAFSLGVLFIISQTFILKIAFYFVADTPEMQQYVREYFSIYIWGAPVVLGMHVVSGWFIGMQDARTPMFISIATNIVNIVLSLFFVYSLGMQIKGVALGSLLAQIFAFILSVFLWNRRYASLKKLASFVFLKNISTFKPFFQSKQ